jgi:hypothetical protein
MTNICCAVRHIKMQFLPKNITRTQYAESVAKRYGHTIETLRQFKPNNCNK